MTAARWLALAAVALPYPAAAQEEIPLEAPRPLRAQLDRLRHADPAVRAGAAAALGGDDRNAPFLRVERLAATSGDQAAAFQAALAPIEARAWQRHAGRAKGWAKERRLDLLCEYLAGCPEGDAAGAIDLVLPIQQAIHAKAFAETPEKNRPTGFIPAGSVTEVRGWFAPTDAAAVTPESGAADTADGWTFDGRRVLLGGGKLRYSYGAVVASRNRLRLTNPKSALGWSSSVVLSNGPAELAHARAALVVVDSDVTLCDGAHIGSSVVVATGSVTSPATTRRVPQVGVVQSRLHAVGPVELPGATADEKTHFQSGGLVTIWRPETARRNAVEGATLVPYGIRFVSLDDFGVRVGATAGGVTVAGVEPWSPLARYGVRAGDLVIRVGFESTRTPDDLRRALRRGVIEESAAFHLRRGGERLTRVVYLDGISNRR